jgi:SAM-dependent methyltransferase
VCVVVRRRASQLDEWPRPSDPSSELDWGRPEYSRRLLLEHLDQRNDSASRSRRAVQAHIRRLQRMLPRPPARLLDAGCGPGLYAVPLARLGYEVVGVDVSPAAVRYARREARAAGLSRAARFIEADLGDYTPDASSFDTVLLVYYVLEAFPRAAQQSVLRRLGTGLAAGGRLIVEMRMRPDQLPGRLDWWEIVPRSILSDRRHLLLGDTTYDRRRNVYVLREIAVFDDGSTAAQQSTAWLVSWERLPSFFARAGLRISAMYDGWSTRRATQLSDSVVVVATPAPRARSVGKSSPDQPRGIRRSP